MSDGEFRKKIAAELCAVGVADDDDFVEYIDGILADDVLSMDERKETVMELVTGAADSAYDETAIKAVVESIMDQLILHTAKTANNIAPAPLKKSTLADLVVEQTVAHVKKTDELTAEELEKAFGECHHNEDDMQETKRRIVEQYAVQFDDTVEFNEEGVMKSGLKEAGISIKLASSNNNGTTEANDVWANDNRSQVVRAAQAQREQSKAEHEKEQMRIKLQQQNEKLKREKEKQRVTKKERRTGR